MSDVKKEIKFNKSMTSDKRDENFAYLRKNILPIKSEGLYPSKDFVDIDPDVEIPSNSVCLDILGSDKTPFQIKGIFYNSDTGETAFRNLYGGGTDNSSLPSGVFYSASAFGSDGVYVLGRNDSVYKLSHTTGSTTVVGTIAGNPASGGVGGWDGKYYWWANNNGIYQQLPNASGTEIMTTVGQTILKMAFLNDQMILVYKSGTDIGILFWDKLDTLKFDKRVIVKNSTYLGLGVVDGTLILTRSVGNSANPKEYAGEIVVAGYDGENFRTLNSIRAGRRDVRNPSEESGQNCDTGSEVMLFSVDDNSITDRNEDLGQNYIYKVKKDGSIEAQYLPVPRGTVTRAHLVRVFYDFTLYAMNSSVSGSTSKIYSNREISTNFSDYENYNNTEYITPFLTNAFNYHKLDGFSVTFEKMFKNTSSATTPPTVSPDTIIVSNLLFTTLTLGWTKATDEVTAQNLLEYSVYKSTTSNINTVADIIANGTKILDWTADVNTFNATGLTDNTDHYFNILVRDTAGNMSKYGIIMAHTYVTSLMTSWVSPTANGIAKWYGEDMNQFTTPANAYAEDGIFAVADNSSEQTFNTYSGFGASLVPLGATVVGIQVRSVMKSNYTGTTFSISLTKEIDNSGGVTDIATQSNKIGKALTLTSAEYIYETPVSLWGTTFTAAEINGTFGLIARGNTTGGSPGYTYSIDNLQVRIFYTI